MTQVVFLVLPTVELLDLAGPAQLFFEANGLGANYRLRYCGLGESAISAQRLAIANLEQFRDVVLQPTDILFVPGVSPEQYSPIGLSEIDDDLFVWLNEVAQNGTMICSICTGAFVLGEAGLLNCRSCTTHWRRTKQLQSEYPQANVLNNRLFVQDGNLFSSAGIASGIDLGLALLEKRHGPRFAAAVARELVVYVRRDGNQPQKSIYLAYRDHLSSPVHEVQDWLIANMDKPNTLRQLANRVHLSPRHLTRLFKEATGITIKSFMTQIRLEQAKILLADPQQTVESVAARCGFKDARQLRRLWQVQIGHSPSIERKS